MKECLDFSICVHVEGVLSSCVCVGHVETCWTQTRVPPSVPFTSPLYAQNNKKK